MDVWLGLNVLLFASAALAYTSPVQASQRPESFKRSDQAVDVYNRGSRENAAFRLLETEIKHGETFRAKRSIQNGGRGDRTGIRLKKRKCQGGARCAKPVRTGSFSALSQIEEDTPVLNPKRFQDRNIDRNGKRPNGKKCILGNKCKKEPSRSNPGIFSAIRNKEPAAAEKKDCAKHTQQLLRPKRSLNTNGSSNGNRRRPTKTKCKTGSKCNKTEPINVSIGRYSAIASPPLDSEEV